MQMLVSSSRGAFALVLGACVSVQLGSGLATQLMTSAGTFGTLAFRLGLSACAFLIICRPRVWTWTGAQWRGALTLGLCLGGMNAAFYLALARIPLGAAVTLEFLGPLTLSAFLSRGARQLMAVALALVGVVVIGGLPAFVGDPLDPTGIGLALVAGGFWALYILATSRVATEIPGLDGLAIGTVAAALLAIPFGVEEALSALMHGPVLGLAIVMAALSTVVPYALELMAIRRLSPRAFGILLSLEPAMAVIVGWLLLDQALTGTTTAGVTMVILASIGAQRSA